jgi:hypothetical protein
MSSQLTAKQHPRPYGHVAAMIHPRGLSTGCRAWRGRSACCSRMSGYPALSRAFRLLGLRRGLGVGVGTWSGRRTPLAADRCRAGHRPRGMPNLGVEGHLARDLRQPDSPPRPGQSRTRRRTADQLIAAGQAAEQQPRSEQAERARANPALEQRKSDVPVPADRGSSATCQEDMRPRKGQADDAHIGVWGLSGDTRSRSIDLRLRRPHEMSSRSGGRRRPHTPRSGRAETPDHEPNASRWWHREREEQSWLSLRAGLQCRPCCMTWPRRRRRCG